MRHAKLWSHERQLPAEAGSIPRARHFVRGLLLEHGMPDLVDDVHLVVSELATNAVRHANTPFTVTLEQVGQAVVLTVADGSPAPPVRLTADLLTTGGRGLAIVESLSRGWGIHPTRSGTGKSVWASFAITAETPSST